MAEADRIVSSDLTCVECDRTLIHAEVMWEIPRSEVAHRRELFEATTARWTLLRISPGIVARARQPFPGDPVRSLDALHLASALVAKGLSEDFSVLSLDRRVRRTARALGLGVMPLRIPSE
jgi:hypothetical protein